jgi:hypothetical protein
MNQSRAVEGLIRRTSQSFGRRSQTQSHLQHNGLQTASSGVRYFGWQGHGTDLLGDSLSQSDDGIPKVRAVLHILRILDWFYT